MVEVTWRVLGVSAGAGFWWRPRCRAVVCLWPVCDGRGAVSNTGTITDAAFTSPASAHRDGLHMCPPPPGRARVNPRPGGGLSHLRHGGGGQNDPPPLTRKLGKLEGRAMRRSTALSEPVRSHFGHFFAQVNIEVSRGHQRSNFRKIMVFSGMPAIISGTITATPNPKKAKDSS